MPPTTPHTGKFSSCGLYSNNSLTSDYTGSCSAAENPYSVPQPLCMHRSASTRGRHFSIVPAENPYSSCPSRHSQHASNSGSSEQSCQSNALSKRRLYGHGVTTSYGEMCYHDNSLVSASLEALVQHLVPTVDYYPDVSTLTPPLWLRPSALCKTLLCSTCSEVIRLHLPAELPPLPAALRALDSRLSPVC